MYARSSAFSLRLLFSFSSKYFESLLHDRTKPFEFDRINWFLINRPINRSLLCEEKNRERAEKKGGREKKKKVERDPLPFLFVFSSLSHRNTSSHFYTIERSLSNSRFSINRPINDRFLKKRIAKGQRRKEKEKRRRKWNWRILQEEAERAEDRRISRH